MPILPDNIITAALAGDTAITISQDSWHPGRGTITDCALLLPAGDGEHKKLAARSTTDGTKLYYLFPLYAKLRPRFIFLRGHVRGHRSAGYRFSEMTYGPANKDLVKTIPNPSMLLQVARDHHNHMHTSYEDRNYRTRKSPENSKENRKKCEVVIQNSLSFSLQKQHCQCLADLCSQRYVGKA